MKSNQSFPIIHAEGTPYEIGYIHGSEAKEQIENSINTYNVMFRDYSNMDWETAKELSKTYIDNIKAFDSDLFEEINGVADGAGKDLEDILALNLRSEIVLSGEYLDGCTSLALSPEMSFNKETLIAQNWDWKPSQKQSFIILKIKQNNKPDVYMVTEAGIIGKLGFNSSGIGVCLNALASDQRPQGTPLHIVLRGILNADTLSEAIGVIGNAGIACPANFLAASKKGDVITIEATPDDYDVMYGSEGFITHGNHFISPRLINIKDTGKNIFPDSFIRLGKMNKFIRSFERKIDIKDIQKILTDHTEYPHAICRHEDLKEEEGKRIVTVFSLIMNLDRMEMHIAPGPPCTFQYDLYRM